MTRTGDRDGRWQLVDLPGGETASLQGMGGRGVRPAGHLGQALPDRIQIPAFGQRPPPLVDHPEAGPEMGRQGLQVEVAGKDLHPRHPSQLDA